MPNWVDQDFHIVGRKTEVDRFIRSGYVRRHPEQFDDLIFLDRLCPPPSPRKGRRKSPAAEAPDLGVVLAHFRTRTQAMFSMQTRWDYPADFYNRLPAHWPELSFAASVNEEMGAFGGVIVIVDGEVIDAVRDYEQGYDRRSHVRAVRAALKRWNGLLCGDRPWRLIPHCAWEHRSMPFDAHFDDDFWFYFRTREEMAGFRARYRSAHPQRREGKEWRRTR